MNDAIDRFCIMKKENIDKFDFELKLFGCFDNYALQFTAAWEQTNLISA